jgi:iron complex outermembrane receptor protein
MNRFKETAARVVWLGGLVSAAAPVFAQDTGHATGALEEIIVTAEKREGTVQDTPISITAFSGQDLAQAGLTSTDALAAYTPGLTIQKEVIGKVVIRGIGTENYTVGSDPGVAIHTDGVYLARSSVSIFDFFDTNRIEVLRGPQGTLYGRNATGGVINILSNEPTSEFGGYATLDVGNYSKVRVEGALNMPFSDSIDARLSVLYAQRDGYTENKFPGADAIPADEETGFPGVPALTSARSRDVDQLDNQDLFAARGQVKFRLTDDVDLLLLAQFTRDDSLPPAFKYFNGAPWQAPTDLDLSDLREVSQGFESEIPGSGRTVPSPGKADQDNYMARLTWDLGNMRFTSITGYRDIDFSWINDGDGFDQFFVTYFQTDESQQFTQEFQLASQGDGKLQWIVGAYYLDESAETFTGIPFIIPVPEPYILWDGKSDTTAYALFGQGTYSLTDRLRITAGLRYNKEEKKGDLTYNVFGTVLTPDLLGFGPPGTTWAQILDRDWDATTPKLAVDYDFTSDVMGYASITRGFKSGGFNLLAGQLPYDPEYVWAYELGLKSRLADGRVTANIGAFYYDYSDLQVGKVVNLSATVVNAAKATIQGMEAEVRAAVGMGVELNAGLSWLDATYDEFVTEDPGYPGAAGNCGSLLEEPRTVSLAGCELPRSPEYQGNLGAQWTGNVGNGAEVRVRADYAFRGKQYFTQFNRDDVSQGSYQTLGLRVGYSAPEDRWSVTAYGDNLTDEEYFATVLESGVAAPGTVVPQAVVGAPRTYGVIFSIKY